MRAEREENSFLKIYEYGILSVSKCIKGTVVFYTPHHSSRGGQLLAHKLNPGELWLHLQSSPGSDCPGLSGSSPLLADAGMPRSTQPPADPCFCVTESVSQSVMSDSWQSHEL